MPQSQFPKWKYSKDGKSKVVENQEQEDALGKDWHDTPATAGLVEIPDYPPEELAKSASPSDILGMLERIKALEEENAQLRKQLDGADGDEGIDHMTKDQLFAEADKLREAGFVVDVKPSDKVALVREAVAAARAEQAEQAEQPKG